MTLLINKNVEQDTLYSGCLNPCSNGMTLLKGKGGLNPEKLES